MDSAAASQAIPADGAGWMYFGTRPIAEVEAATAEGRLQTVSGRSVFESDGPQPTARGPRMCSKPHVRKVFVNAILRCILGKESRPASRLLKDTDSGFAIAKDVREPTVMGGGFKL